MIIGISHITLIVADLNLSSLFFENIFGAKVVYSSPTAKYILINDLWVALNKGESLSEQTYNHIAFKINDNDIDSYIKRVQDFGIELIQGRARSEGEGRSIYFYDYDNHLFELHSGTLSERLDSYNKIE